MATAGLAPSAISFPIRKLFHKAPNVHVRVAEVDHINHERKYVATSIGDLNYDHLVIATGAGTNFFGNQNILINSYGMKTTEESLQIRNHLLECMENALIEEDEEKRAALLTVTVVGGGPTGVELAGALSEMKRYILPKDYPEIDFSLMKIYLIEASDRILSAMSAMSEKSS